MSISKLILQKALGNITVKSNGDVNNKTVAGANLVIHVAPFTNMV